jgi:ABC-type multidrug transport system permease subunit
MTSVSFHFEIPANGFPASTTGSFYSRCAALFFAILLNAFSSALEILTLYAQRPIVEKHAEYAFYRPSAEAFASMLCDIPYKLLNAVFFNTIT